MINILLQLQQLNEHHSSNHKYNITYNTHIAINMHPYRHQRHHGDIFRIPNAISQDTLPTKP